VLSGSEAKLTCRCARAVGGGGGAEAVQARPALVFPISVPYFLSSMYIPSPVMVMFTRVVLRFALSKARRCSTGLWCGRHGWQRPLDSLSPTC
jgi:hypothetical protein